MAKAKKKTSRSKARSETRRHGEANYFAGRRAEYRSMDLLERAGMLTVRAAGSKGPADIVAIGGGPPILVQVKRGQRGITPIEREKLKAIRARYNCMILVHRWRKHARHPETEEIN